MKVRLFYGNTNIIRNFPGNNNANNREEALIKLGVGFVRMPGSSPLTFVNIDMVTHMEFYDDADIIT